MKGHPAGGLRRWQIVPGSGERRSWCRLALLAATLVLVTAVWLGAPRPGSSPAHHHHAGDATRPRPAAPLAAGLTAAVERRWMDALEALHAAVRSGAETAEAHRALGLSLGNLGWMEDAAREYRQAIRLEPSHVDTYVSLSTTYRSVGRRREALLALRQALPRLRAGTSRDASARYARRVAPQLETLAQAYAYLGEFAKALRLASDAQTADPTRAGGYLVAGKSCLTLNQIDKAIPMLRRACVAANDSADAHYTLALALRKRPSPDHDESALQHLTRAVSLNPRLAPGHLQLGILYAGRSQWKKAHGAFIAAYELHFEPIETLRRAGEAYWQAGDTARARYLLGQHAMKVGALPAALRHFRALREIPAYRVSGYSHTAAALREMGKPQAAIVTLREALALEPGSAELYRQLGSAYSVAQQVGEQVAALRSAAELDPANAHRDWLILGLLSVDRGEYDQAESYLQRCIRLQPENGEYHYALGKTYLARSGNENRLQSAIRHLEAGRRWSAENVFVHDYLSAAYAKARRWQEAAQSLRRAIDLAPQNSRLYYRLGQVCQRLAREDEARRVLGYYHRLRRIEVEKDLLQRRCRARPDDIRARGRLADLLLTVRDYEAARRESERLIALDPRNAAAHEKLATAYGELSQPEAQWRHLQLARRIRQER